MRDVRWFFFFFMYHNSRLQRITAMRFRRRFRNSREVSQFYPFGRVARDDSSYRANSGCPRFPDLCDRKSVERAVASLLSPEMRYLGRRGRHAQLFVPCGQFYTFVWLASQKISERPIQSFTRIRLFRQKIHRWSFFYIKREGECYKLFKKYIYLMYYIQI